MSEQDTPTNGRAKPRKNFTKVVMLDRSFDPIVNAKGEPSDDPTEAHAFDITVGGSTLRCEPFAYSSKIQNGLVIFGAKQRFTNAIGGLPEDESFEKISQIDEAMKEGEDWSRTGTGPRLATLAEAIVRLKTARGETAEVEVVKARLKTLSVEQVKEYSAAKDVTAAMSEIKAEKAAARAKADKAAATTAASDFSSLGI